MKFKKILAGVLASAMTLTAGILPDITPSMQTEMTASAEDELNYGDYLSYIKIDEDEDGTYDYIWISKCNMSAVSVEIPSEIDGLPVTSIGSCAFSYCKSLESIKILNPDCKIYDSENTITNSTIYGYENSTAQAYAEKYNKNFALIGDINNDGEILVADIVLLKDALVKKDEITFAMDLNGDNKIDVFDLIILKRKVIG